MNMLVMIFKISEVISRLAIRQEQEWPHDMNRYANHALFRQNPALAHCTWALLKTILNNAQYKT